MALNRRTARNIFAIGSVACFVALALLTMDFEKLVAERTNEAQAMTAQVIRGKEVWEKYNCVNCHTRLGEGAYYAPDLTKSFTRMGKGWMQHMLLNPAAAYWGPEWNQKGRRKMPKLGLSEPEALDVVAFLEFLSQIDTNDWPPPESFTPSTWLEPDTDAWRGREVFERLKCKACHPINGRPSEANLSTDLTFVVSRLPIDWIRQEIRTPPADWPSTPMPDFGTQLLPDEDIELLIAFLRHTNKALGGVEIAPAEAQQ